MKADNFCYWLQGVLEVAKPETLDAEQVEIIKRHLAMVFYNALDKQAPESKHAGLNTLHAGTMQANPSNSDILYRC